MSHISNGTKLHNLFKQLGIDPGNHGPQELDAWFNPDSEEFLTWFLNNITTENVLTSQEKEAYERLCEEGLVVSEDTYEEAVQEMEDDFPGIFNVDENSFEIQCLNNEIAIYKEDLKNVEEVLVAAEECSELLKLRLSLKERECVSSKIEEEKANEECLKLSKDLENVNQRLEEQLIKYQNQLINYDELNNYQLEDHMKYFHDVNGAILKFLDEEKLENRDVTVLPMEIDEALEEMQNRISNAIYNGFQNKIKLETLEAEIEYLNNLNICDASSYSLHKKNSYEIEAMLISKEEKLKTLNNELKRVAIEESTKFINLSKVNKIEMEIENTNKKIEFMETLNGKFCLILAYQIFLLMLYDQENISVRKTEELFKQIASYINNDLQEITTRTVILDNVIKDQKEFVEKPFEHRYKFIRNYLTFITGEPQLECDIKEALKITDKFQMDFINAQRRILEHNKKFKLNTKIIEENIGVMQEFLVSGPSSEITLIPNCLYDVFQQVSEAFEHREAQIKSLANLPNSTQKRIAGKKWLKIRRQLWMYFIMSPKKVLLYLDQIKIEAAKQQNCVS